MTPALSLNTLLRVFLPFGAGYFLSYLYRVVNAVIAPDLIADIGIGPSALGLLTATYFITFAAFQLPLGLLLDRFGPRRTEAALLLLAGLGALVFSRADSLSGLIVGRALIGFGVSACLMAAFKAYTLWFSREKWPLINGFQMACGGLGALAATSPVEAMLGFTDWRGVFLLLSALTFLTAALVFLVVPERETGTAESLADQLSGIGEVFTSLKFWQAAPLITMSQAGFLSIQGLWAGPWLKDVAGLDRTEVADTLFWIAVAMIAGFILLGALAGRLGRGGISPLKTSALGMSVFMVMQLLVLVSPVHLSSIIWPIFGFFGTSGIIAYAGLSQLFPVHLSGRVTTAVNLLVFVAAFFSQWAIGAIIGLWPVAADGGFAAAGYRTAFFIMLAIQVLSLVWFFAADRFRVTSSWNRRQI
jgi:MFS family permease